MDKNLPLLITISRQFGSGGSYVGEKIAEQLKFLYLDRDIILKSAKQFNMSPEKLESVDEKYHHSEMKIPMLSFLSRKPFEPTDIYVPASSELHEAEAKIILQITKNQSSVIVGRGANFVLANNPNHISIFLHADTAFRQSRIEEIYKLSPEKALKFLEKMDKERAKYLKIFTNEKMTNASQYNLTLDTGALGLEGTIAVILAYINYRK